MYQLNEIQIYKKEKRSFGNLEGQIRFFQEELQNSGMEGTEDMN